MNAKEARKVAELAVFLKENNEVEKVLRNEIVNSAGNGEVYLSCWIHCEHNANTVVESLRNDGYNVTCHHVPKFIGTGYKYEISW